MRDASNLSDTIIPKSDQLNAEQLYGGPITITITDVRRGTSDDQPVSVSYRNDGGRPYKPCKSMRKVMIFAWGDDGRAWVGKSMTLYNDPEVKFGGIKVGGIRISHMSHIDRDIQIALTTTKGKKSSFLIQRLSAAKAPAAFDLAEELKALEGAARGGMKSLIDAWNKVDNETRKQINGGKGCPDHLKELAASIDVEKKAQNQEATA